jgi:hypothetical protein
MRQVTLASQGSCLDIMLRIYFLQHWFNLSDPAAEEALYDSAALRRFAGVDLGRAPAPDETIILNFHARFTQLADRKKSIYDQDLLGLLQPGKSIPVATVLPLFADGQSRSRYQRESHFPLRRGAASAVGSLPPSAANLRAASFRTSLPPWSLDP